ncbi:C40 family peptidase [Oceanirhabdus sp. W0125-5]|uniref:C40 family peptidase n=1 Tax=Oceanirhabdus sp. W0125-5 TaxID=2999116 RepID=UPI0022F2C671|nr:C40 family peptidase [Oceanirhabdus sp. W0125-5]WBW94749.1 NlpC/P60 family protein [Oceanirhabdus sp. W0125-5]
MKNNKKIIYFLLIVICLNAFNVFADNEADLNNKINRLQKTLENNKGNKDEINRLMNDIEVQLEDLSIEIEKLDYQQEKMNEEIEKNKENIMKLEIQISQLEKEMEEEEKRLEEKKNTYAKQAKFLYVKGISSQVEMILSSKSWDAVVTNVSIVRKLSKYNKKLFDEITKGMEKIESDRKELEANKRNIELLLAENQKKNAEIDAAIADKNTLKNKVAAKKADYEDTLRSYNIEQTNTEKQIQQAKRQLEELRRKAQEKPINVGDVTGENILALASKFLGDPYLWGGTRPYDGTYSSGFDCSGLTQYVYAQFGITTGRVTYQQIKHPNGRYVARKDLKIGDLVFFGTKYDPHHVGIYAGNNTYLHAPRTGDVIKISPMTRRDYVEGRRFLPD